MPATIFDKPIFPGAKIVSAEVTVTNTSGSYSQSFSDDRISASMRAFQIEIDDPSIFNDKITITTSNGSFTIACNSVAGETTVNIGFLKIADDQQSVTSTEFTILNNRIGDLDDLETTDQTSMVNAVNEVVGSVSSNSQAIANLFTGLDPLSDCLGTQTKALDNNRKFSDYKYLYVTKTTGTYNDVYNSMIIPISFFTSSTNRAFYMYNPGTSGTLNQNNIKYVDDTHVSFGQDNSTFRTYIYGIK